MATIPTRIDTNALEILKQYSPGSASEAIRIMDNTIRTYKECREGDKPAQETVVKPFQTGTELKRFGKIDKDEELQEPIGRQGRAL